MLSAPAGRMTCLLLSNHLQITCFRSAASSKGSLNRQSAFPSLACTALGHCEMQEILLQFLDGLSRDDAGCVMRAEAHPEHRALQDLTLLNGEDGNGMFADRCEPLSGLDKSQHWSEPCGHGYLGAGYIGLGFQPGSHNCTAFGPELNVIWLGQSSPCVCSEEERKAAQHIYPIDMPNVRLQKPVIDPIQIPRH